MSDVVDGLKGAATAAVEDLALTDWTRERLAGWVAARRDEIEAAFGPATPIDMENPV